MIPVKLELKNFLSYGDSTVRISFKDHSLICLSGKNGNGKSALLDAITWALWGQARKVSGAVKADAGLVRLGQTRMVVGLEFISSGQQYRVKREFSISRGKSQSTLYFDLFDEKKRCFLPFSEKTIKQTQAKIEKTVGLDFDTFINSAFLRQGHSNEFSKKTPKERKQILTNILGLSKYDELSKRAQERARAHLNDQKVLIKLGEQAQKELEEEKTVKSALVEKKKLLCVIEKDLEKTSNKINKIEKERLDLLKQKYQYEQQTKTFCEKKEEFLKIIKLWRVTHARSLKLPDIKSLEEKRKKLSIEEREMREVQQESIKFQEKMLKLILECEKLELVHKQLSDQVKQKEKLIDEQKKKLIEREKKSFELDKILSEQKRFNKNFESLKNQFEKRRIFYQNLVQMGNHAQKELSELHRKGMLVQDKQNPSCPLCEQVLTIKRKEFLSKTFFEQSVFYSHRVDRVKSILKKLKELLFDQHKEVKKQEFKNEQYKQFLANRDSLEKTISEIKKTIDQDQVLLDLLSVREKREKLVCNKFLKDLEIKKKGEKVLYDEKSHKNLTKLLVDIEKQLCDLDDLKKDLSLQQDRRDRASNLCCELKVLKKQKALCEFEPQKEKALKNTLSMLNQAKKEILKERENILQDRARLESEQQRFIKIKKEEKARAKEIKEVLDQAKEYQVLASLFGKDGIQALLIEEAIPEIEQEANKLLSNLTDNKSQIFIESLRDLKKGGVRESLDIHISDSSGIRPYEMFSGGEPFRIDFSLRIAISKLLARRAGTALQTLIIDEGFGSQDEEGLQRLMDAIYAIQKDFLKIIVVSHLPSLKENFPVHFLVGKDSLGSYVKVEQRG